VLQGIFSSSSASRIRKLPWCGSVTGNFLNLTFGSDVKNRNVTDLPPRFFIRAPDAIILNHNGTELVQNCHYPILFSSETPISDHGTA
jgi:hypothetical protein